MKHRLVTPPHKLPAAPPAQPDFDGLRVVLGPNGGLVAITRHGFEAPVELTLAGLNRLHEMLVEQQRKKEIGAFAPIANLCLAEWKRVGGHGEGKIRKADREPIPDLF